MTAADWAGIYGAVIGTAALIVAWRAHVLAKRSAILDGPHVAIGSTVADHPEYVYFQLGGPRAEQFYIDRAHLRWSVDGQICRKELRLNGFGELEIVAAHPQGRSIERPDSPLILTEPLRPGAKIDFILRAKANPRLKRKAPLHWQS